MTPVVYRIPYGAPTRARVTAAPRIVGASRVAIVGPDRMRAGIVGPDRLAMRGLGVAMLDPRQSFMAPLITAGNAGQASAYGGGVITPGSSVAPVAQAMGITQTTIDASVARQAQAEAACRAEGSIADNPFAILRCIAAVSGGASVAAAAARAKNETACAGMTGIDLSQGYSSPGYEQCMRDPQAFKDSLCAQGLLPTELCPAPWFKQPLVLAAIGGVVLVGALVVRKRRKARGASA